ncbi:MAG TPA: hypothetical protein VFF11_02060, partial [Candidatus Binatia bacterium]|nr:hypothetical protein [Candidatus Binatia bacterium]
RLARKPHVIGGCLILAGYFWALAARLPKAVSTDLVRFRRREQMNRLRRMCLRLLGRNELATGTEPARLKLKPCPDEAGGTT